MILGFQMVIISNVKLKKLNVSHIFLFSSQETSIKK